MEGKELTMDENTKRRCDAIMEVHKGCWERISERRTYEWRAAYTLWAAVGAFIAIVMTQTGLFKQSDVPVSIFLLGVVFIGVIFCLIHGFWLKGLGKAHDTDREMAIHYAKILRNLSNSNFEEHFEECLNRQKKQRGLFGDWSRKWQLSITMLLWFVAILMVFLVAS